MVSREYILTGASVNRISKQHLITAIYPNTNETINYKNDPNAVGAYVGVSYVFDRNRSTSELSFKLETYCITQKFDIQGKLPEPISANQYIQGNISLGSVICRRKFDICPITKTIPEDEKEVYEYITSLSPVSTVERGDYNLHYDIPSTAISNMVTYGIACIPTVKESMDELYEELDTSDNYDFVYLATWLISEEAYLEVIVQNPASPGTANQISPTVSSILISNRDNTISWKYSQEFEAPQYYVGITAKYLDTGETQEICRKQIISAENGTVSSYTIPAGTLRTGNVRLTISAMPHDSANYYAEDDAIWTSGANVDYTVKATPEAGAVSCDGKPNPTVSWTSSTQAAFQVRFGDFDSGVVAGSETSYTIPKIFDDGNYAVSIRTATSAGEWSEWTEETYISIINNAPAGTITLKASQFDNNIQLNWESDISGAKYVIYRDEEMIGVTDSTAFIDRFSAGTSEYKIRAVLNGNYSESQSITFDLQLRSDVISIDGGYTYKLLKYTTAPKSQTDLFTDDITYQYYSGREKPIAISSGHVERLKRFSYAFKKRSEALFLRQMRGKAVLIKTTRGCVIYGILGELQMTEAKLTTASFAVREIYREGEDVEYVS